MRAIDRRFSFTFFKGAIKKFIVVFTLQCIQFVGKSTLRPSLLMSIVN